MEEDVPLFPDEQGGVHGTLPSQVKRGEHVQHDKDEVWGKVEVKELGGATE